MNWKILKIIIIFVGSILVGYGVIVAYETFFMTHDHSFAEDINLPEINNVIIDQEIDLLDVSSDMQFNIEPTYSLDKLEISALVMMGPPGSDTSYDPLDWKIKASWRDITKEEHAIENFVRYTDIILEKKMNEEYLEENLLYSSEFECPINPQECFKVSPYFNTRINIDGHSFKSEDIRGIYRIRVDFKIVDGCVDDIGECDEAVAYSRDFEIID